jgi:hypothetical protein
MYAEATVKLFQMNGIQKSLYVQQPCKKMIGAALRRYIQHQREADAVRFTALMQVLESDWIVS